MSTNYQVFINMLNNCMAMSKEYLQRAIIEGKIDPNNSYYFSNLLAISADNSNRARIICSNTNPDDTNEAVKGFNLRYVTIDEELFNKSSEEFDKAHVDKALMTIIHMMSEEDKLTLYDAIKNSGVVELPDSGGL